MGLEFLGIPSPSFRIQSLLYWLMVGFRTVDPSPVSTRLNPLPFNISVRAVQWFQTGRQVSDELTVAHGCMETYETRSECLPRKYTWTAPDCAIPTRTRGSVTANHGTGKVR